MMRLISCCVVVLCLNLLLIADHANAGTQAVGKRFVMVTYWGSDEVALVDLKGEAGHEQVWVLNVYDQDGCAKPYDVKVNQGKAIAYVSCSGSDEIAAIDLIAQLLHHKIKTGSSPRDIALTPDGRRAVVANSGEDTIAVVDLESGQTVYKVDVPTQPYGVALIDDGKTALITGWASGDLHFVKIGESSGEIIKTIAIGTLPYTVVAAEKQGLAYVSANADHRVVAVDLKAQVVVKSVQVGRNPWGLGLSPDGDVLLVANNRSGDLSILRGTGSRGEVLTEATRLNLGQGGRSGNAVSRAAKNATVSFDGLTGVVTDLANNDLLVLNLESHAISRVIAVGRAPYGIDFAR